MTDAPLTMTSEQDADVRLKAEYAGYPGHRECAILVPEVDALRSRLAEVERENAALREALAVLREHWPLGSLHHAAMIADAALATSPQGQNEKGQDEGGVRVEEEHLHYPFGWDEDCKTCLKLRRDDPRPRDVSRWEGEKEGS